MLEAALIELAQKASVVQVAPAPSRTVTARAWPKPVTAECVVAEAQRQSLELVKLMAVMKTEAGRVGMFSRNTDGSYDIGPMQVNSIHLPELSKTFGVPPAAVAQLLGYDGCFNVAVGAWLLRKRTNEANGDFWYGIGRYHSKTPIHARRYILRVHQNMMTLLATKTDRSLVAPSQSNAATAAAKGG